jgi:serine/threonine protein kinase/Tol biopolymer transport system component
MEHRVNEPERWQQVEGLFHAVLALDEPERPGFLRHACADDDSLRRELDSLLTFERRSPAFMRDSALEAAAVLLSSDSTTEPPDRQLGPYVIGELLGSGGMGNVYRARDTKLERPVAIKFLSDDVADPAARHRFHREARMASSLNHPHIVTVHDAGDVDGRLYLVTEFVDGGTLRDWMREPHGWRGAVELLSGVAEALATAHEAGILHRDIKPENILLAKNGYAKLGDFGLAKLHAAATGGTAAPPTTDGRTQPWIIVGTAAYMSPEQAAGHSLDARSDIFSFGVVLYEALAGQRPFTGPSATDVLHAIMHTPASPLPDDVPPALRRVVDKALAKDPSQRYQTMRQIVTELRHVTLQSGEVSLDVTARPRVRSRRQTSFKIGAIVLAAAVAAALMTWRARSAGDERRPAYVQLTSFTDSVVSPVLSPDGRMLAFIRAESAVAGSPDRPGEVYVKLLPDGEPVQLTRDGYPKLFPAFSPDGSRIAYTTIVNDLTLDTWTVPVLGGPPQRLLANASGLTWISGGAAPRVMYSEFVGRGFQMAVATSTESRTQHRTVYLPPAESGMAHRSQVSPDGRHVLVVEMDFNGWLPCRLVPFDGSSQGTPVGPSPAQCTDATWSPDGKWMYFSTNTGTGASTWRQRFPNGTPEQVTAGVTEEEGIRFAADGRTFVTSIGGRQSEIWIHGPTGERQITSEGFAFFPNISPDGTRVFYIVRESAARNFMTGGLWSTELETGQRRRWLPDFQMLHYTISADGQRVVFVAADGGHTPVWLASLDGQTPPRRIAAADSWVAYFGPPGEVVFAGAEKTAGFIYRVREDGTSLQKVSSTPLLLPFGVSPDGRWVPAAEGPAAARDQLMVYPIDGGSPVPICRCYPAPNIDAGPLPPQMAWTPDARFLYLKFGTSTYAIPLRSGQMLPRVPASGFPSADAVAALPGAQLVSHDAVFPGPNPSIYAVMKLTTQRNIYRVSVR